MDPAEAEAQAKQEAALMLANIAQTYETAVPELTAEDLGAPVMAI